MIKTMTTGELQMKGNLILNNWDSYKNDIKLTSANLYRLIGLKHQIQDHMVKIAETVTTVVEQHNGERNQDGSLSVPPEKVDEVNKILDDLAKETVEIEYQEVKVRSEDSLPIELMESIFDFIVVEEE